MVCEADPEHRTYGEVIAEQLVKRAAKGDIQAAAELADRVEGKPRQSIGLSREEVQHHAEISRFQAATKNISQGSQWRRD